MKKVKLICAIGSFLLIGMSFTACNSSKTDDKANATQEEQTETISKDEYKCPMNCEPDKVYHEPGQCPVCEMDLKKVDS